MRDRGETQTAQDAPAREVDADLWEKARLVSPHRRKVHTGPRIDADVLDWFKAKGAVGRRG